MKIILTFGFALIATSAIAESDLSAKLKEIREHRISTEGYRAIASYALEDYAEAKGEIDGCQMFQDRPDFEALTAKYGAWAKAGFWNWLTGEQDKVSEHLLRSLNLTYVTAKIRPDCSPIMQSTLEMTAAGYLRMFEDALRQAPD